MEERTDEQRKESQRLHQESQHQYDNQQNALCFVVIGSILVVIGVIFIFLANKRENNVMIGIQTNTMAFYVMVIGRGLGGILLLFGLMKFIVSSVKRKKIIHAINELK